MKLSTLLLSLFAILAPISGELINRAVYTLQNKKDFNFLTAIKKAGFPVTDVWRDSPSQKWRAFKGYFGSSFMLKPTSDESVSIFVNKRIVGISGSGFALSSSQYWTVWEADHKGFYMIKNASTEECLESTGPREKVTMSRCRNIPEQQWAIHRR